LEVSVREGKIGANEKSFSQHRRKKKGKEMKKKLSAERGLTPSRGRKGKGCRPLSNPRGGGKGREMNQTRILDERGKKKKKRGKLTVNKKEE